MCGHAAFARNLNFLDCNPAVGACHGEAVLAVGVDAADCCGVQRRFETGGENFCRADLLAVFVHVRPCRRIRRQTAYEVDDCAPRFVPVDDAVVLENFRCRMQIFVGLCLLDRSDVARCDALDTVENERFADGHQFVVHRSDCVVIADRNAGLPDNCLLYTSPSPRDA